MKAWFVYNPGKFARITIRVYRSTSLSMAVHTVTPFVCSKQDNTIVIKVVLRSPAINLLRAHGRPSKLTCIFRVSPGTIHPRRKVNMILTKCS